MFIEDIFYTLDQHLKPLTYSRTVFLISTVIFSFILTLMGLILVERSKAYYYVNLDFLKYLERLAKVLIASLTILSLLFYLVYVFKSIIMYRLPIEYFIGWSFYYLLTLILLLVVKLRLMLPRIMNMLMLTIWVFMILGLSCESLRINYFVSEDTLDIITLAQQGHIFKSMHAPHYDLAPMHVHLYVIISQVLGYQVASKVSSYPAILITFSLLLSTFMMLGAFIDSMEIHESHKKILLKALVPVLLTLHPYSLGILSTSHVNSLSGVLALLTIVLLSKHAKTDKFTTSQSTSTLLILILLMLVTSILTHPQGFVIAFLASIFLMISIKLNNTGPLTYILTVTLIFALILFILKGFYTGAFQSLQSFASYMLEAFLRGLKESIGGNIEIAPRTYQKMPISANGGYATSLGMLTALTIHAILRQPNASKSKQDPLLLFVMLSNVLILALAIVSFYIILAGMPTKYVVGSYMPLISLTVLLYLTILLKKREPGILGLIVIIMVMSLSSLLSLTSPLKTPGNYRVLQGAVASIDGDVDYAIKLLSLIEYKPVEGYIVIQYAFPVDDLREHNIDQALAVYVSSVKFYIKYNYDESVLSNLNILFNYWIYMLGYKES